MTVYFKEGEGRFVNVRPNKEHQNLAGVGELVGIVAPPGDEYDLEKPHRYMVKIDGKIVNARSEYLSFKLPEEPKATSS